MSDTPSPDCSIQRTLDVIGDRWTLLILRDVFRGVRRFSRIQDDLGIARNLLTDRLGRLVEAGIVEKIPYQDRPVRHPAGAPALVHDVQRGRPGHPDRLPAGTRPSCRAGRPHRRGGRPCPLSCSIARSTS